MVSFWPLHVAPAGAFWDGAAAALVRLLGCRVIELVLSGASEAALDAAVGPQPVDDVGQVLRQDALLLRSCRQRKQLSGVVLGGWGKHRRMSKSKTTPGAFSQFFTPAAFPGHLGLHVRFSLDTIERHN